MTTTSNARQTADVAPGRTGAVEVVVPITTKNPTNTREHWAVRAKRVKAQRGLVGLALRTYNVYPRLALRPMAIQPLVVTLARVSPRSMDDDGAIAALKHVRDEVAAYFGVNDNDPRVTWRYEQRKGKAAVIVRLEVA